MGQVGCTVEVGEPEKNDRLEGDSDHQLVIAGPPAGHAPIAPIVPLTAGKGGGRLISFICFSSP